MEEVLHLLPHLFWDLGRVLRMALAVAHTHSLLQVE